MSDNITVNVTQPSGAASENSNIQSVLGKFLNYFIYLVIIGLLIGVIFAIYVLVDNWDWIVTTFTTGFLGWLNPFDDDAGDTGPIDSVVGSDAAVVADSLWFFGPFGWLFR